MEGIESVRTKPTPPPKPAVPPNKPAGHVHSSNVSSTSTLVGGLPQRTVAAPQSQVIGMADAVAPPGQLGTAPGAAAAAADAAGATCQQALGCSPASADRPGQGRQASASRIDCKMTGTSRPGDPGKWDLSSADHSATGVKVSALPPAAKNTGLHSEAVGSRVASLSPSRAKGGGSSGASSGAASVTMVSSREHGSRAAVQLPNSPLPLNATVRTMHAHNDGLAASSVVVAGHVDSAATAKVTRDEKPPLPKHKPVVVSPRLQRSDIASNASAASAAGGGAAEATTVTAAAAPVTASSVTAKAFWSQRAGSADTVTVGTSGEPSAVTSSAPPPSRKPVGRSASFADHTPTEARVLGSLSSKPGPVAVGSSKHSRLPSSPKPVSGGGAVYAVPGANRSGDLAGSPKSAAVKSSSSASKLRQRSSSSGSKVDELTSGPIVMPTDSPTSSVSSIIRALSRNWDSSSPAASLPSGRGHPNSHGSSSGSCPPPAASAAGLHPLPAASAASAWRPDGEFRGSASPTAEMSARAAVSGSGCATSASATAEAEVAKSESDDAGYLLPSRVQPHAEAADASNGDDNKTATLGSHHHYSDIDSVGKASTLASSASSHLYEDVVALRGDGDDNRSFSGSSVPDSQSQSVNGDVFCSMFDDTLDGQEREEVDSSTDSDSEPEAEQAKQDKKKRKAYLVAEEIMKTEAEFCDNLKLLNEDFRAFIMEGPEASANPAVPIRLLDRILNYLPQLQHFSSLLTSDLTQRIQQWESNPQVADVFVKKGPFLKLYTTYITEFERATSALDEATKTYPAFAEKVREFESTERCRHLLLRHFMLKPIQRIPQYKLLLTDYLKYVTEDCPDHASAVEALAIVSDVAKHSNEAMKQDDFLQTLLNIQNSLVGDFKVVEPSRKLLKKGELLKHSRRDMQVRTFILFNDVLLMAQPIGSTYKQKYILPLQNMKTSKPAQDDYENEFTIISKQKSFTVVANTPAERESWFDAINKAIKNHEEKLSSFPLGARQSDSGGVGDGILGEVAPVWIPDARVSMCMVCNQQFTVFFRRHHCRGCGKVVCSECSEYKAPLKYDNYQACRVCGRCHASLRARLLDGYEAALAAEESMSPTLPSKESLVTLFRAPSKVDVVPRTRTIKSAVLVEVHAGDAGAVSGYLRIFTKKIRWKRFWFVIKDHVLYKYNASQDTAAIESTVLYGYEVDALGEAFESVDGELLFKLHKPNAALIEPIVFRTETSAAAAKWLAVMKQSVQP